MDIYILMIDDDSDDYLLLNEAVKRYPTLQCLYANGAEEGIYMMATYLPDIVLLDMNMAKINGLECLKSIKKSADICLIPVVIFSTCITDGLSKAALTHGDKRCIKKPTDLDDFDGVINQVVEIVKTSRI